MNNTEEIQNSPDSFKKPDLELTTTKNQQEFFPDIIVDNEIEKHAEPFFFSKLLVRRPYLVFFSCLSFLFLLVGLTFGLGLFKVNERTGRDFQVWSDERVQRNDAIDLAVDEYNLYLQKQEIPGERSVENDFLRTFIIYKAKKGSTLLTPQNLKTMQKVEQHFTTYKQDGKDYQDFCLAVSSTDPTCQSALSTPLTVSGSYSGNNSQDQINGFLDMAKNDDVFFEQISLLFDKSFSQTNTNIKVARSIYQFGFPLEGFKDTIDDDGKQYEQFKLWSREFFKYIEEDQSTDTLEVIFYSRPADLDYSSIQLGKDIIFSMLAGIFVTIYMMIHTKSVGIGATGSLLMFITYPVSYFFYRVIFQIRFFASLNTSVLFLLMGIGADDVFVFFDQFQQAGLIPSLKNDLLRRTSFAYRRASKAMLITSATTVISFLATAISKLLPIRTYGIFAALNITTNYLLIITIFPAYLVLREQFFQKRREKRQKNYMQESNGNKNNQIYAELQSPQTGLQSPQSTQPPHSPQKQELEQQYVENQQQSQKNQPYDTVNIQTQPDQYQEQNNNNNNNKNSDKNKEQEQELSKIQLFFNKYWSDWTYKARFPILILFSALLIFNIVAVSQIETPKEPPSFARDNHFIFKALTSVRSDFPTGRNDGNSIYIKIYWGIKGVDQEDVDPYDPSDQGKIVYDKAFNLAKTENQARILQICDDLEGPNYKKFVSQSEGSVTCFMQQFNSHLQSQNKNFPVPEDDFNQELIDFLENTEDGYNIKQNEEISIINNEIKYVSIGFIGNVKAVNIRTVLEPLYYDYEDIIKNINRNSGSGLNKAFQNSSSWQWMVSEKELINGAIQGIIISLSLAFCILMISTMNILISIYSITCIIGVVSGVFMVIWTKGWEFGTFESMNSIIIIGLSVDYVVHLANSYTESEEKTKEKKTKDMLTVMGVSVLGGGFTTLGAGLFVFGGKLRFFLVMGVLVSSTIGFSMAWSLIFFPVICYLIGPSNDVGNMKILVQRVKDRIKKKKNQE